MNLESSVRKGIENSPRSGTFIINKNVRDAEQRIKNISQYLESMGYEVFVHQDDEEAQIVYSGAGQNA